MFDLFIFEKNEILILSFENFVFFKEKSCFLVPQFFPFSEFSTPFHFGVVFANIIHWKQLFWGHCFIKLLKNDYFITSIYS